MSYAEYATMIIHIEIHVTIRTLGTVQLHPETWRQDQRRAKNVQLHRGAGAHSGVLEGSGRYHGQAASGTMQKGIHILPAHLKDID